MSQAELEDRPGYLIKQVATAFRKVAEERLREIGLSMSQYAVLRALADVPGAPAAELARRTFVTRQSLRDVLGGLQKAGLAAVAAEPAARRTRPVTLTAEGRRRLNRAEALVSDVEERMLAGISSGDLAPLLKACLANLRDEAAAPPSRAGGAAS